MIVKNITVDVNSETKQFNHFFRATGYANADYTYTPALRRMYDCLESYDGYPVYMRLHNILSLHGKGDHYILHEGQDYGNPIIDGSGNVDIVVSMDGDRLKFNWELVDRVYDIIVAHGMHPIVETVFMPSSITDNTKGEKYYYLPKDFRLWEEVITQFTHHCVSRYGIEETRKWYFEIYNEPENYPLWSTDPSSFFALYDYFEYSVHNVDSQLRTGGPAVKQWENGMRFYKAFLNHTSRGVNYKTGSYGTRLDFISVHSKAGEPNLVGPSIDFMFNPLREFIKIKNEFPEYGKTEFFNDESDIVWEGNRGISDKSWLNFRNTHYAPGFTAKMINTYCSVVEDELNVNLGIIDSDNSHLLWEKSFFSGNRSQFTPLGKYPSTFLLKKPIFNIFPILGKLGNERYILKPDDPEYGNKYGVLATKDSTGYAFLVWNFEDGLEEGVNERNIRLHIKNLNDTAVFNYLHFRIDGKHSNAYAVWNNMGRPFPLDKEQTKKLLKHDGPSLLENQTFSGKSELDIEFILPMHSVSLFLLVRKQPMDKESVDRCEKDKPSLFCEKDSFGNAMIFVKWNFSTRKDLLGYLIYRRKGNEKPVIINEPEFTHCSYYYDMDIEQGSYSYSVAAVYADNSRSGLSSENTITIL